MLKLIIPLIILIAALLYAAEPKINFHPFKIQFARGWFVLGITLIGIGVGLVRYQGYNDGTKKGVDAAFTYIKELIKKEG